MAENRYEWPDLARNIQKRVMTSSTTSGCVLMNEIARKWDMSFKITEKRRLHSFSCLDAYAFVIGTPINLSRQPSKTYRYYYSKTTDQSQCNK